MIFMNRLISPHMKKESELKTLTPKIMNRITQKTLIEFRNSKKPQGIAKISMTPNRIYFSKVTTSMLALKPNDRFYLCKDDNNNLYFEHTANLDGFELIISNHGYLIAETRGLLEFLAIKKNVSFIVDEFKEGKRKLIKHEIIPNQRKAKK
jgi:hypothetical protein